MDTQAVRQRFQHSESMYRGLIFSLLDEIDRLERKDKLWRNIMEQVIEVNKPIPKKSWFSRFKAA